MKKITKTAFAAMLTAAMIGCGSGSSATGEKEVKTGTTSSYAYLLDTTDLEKPELDLSGAEGMLKNVLDKGVLTIATSPDYPPNEFVTEDGTVYGSEMMLAKYIADSLGVDLSIETMDFNGTLTAIDTGKVDMAISGYGWKKDRAESYELSVGYSGSDIDYGHTLIVPADKADQYKTLQDFVGKHIICQASSLQQMYVEDQILALDENAGTNMELVTSLDQAILGLSAGKCDAVALDEHTAKQYVESSEGKFAMTGIMFDLSIYGDYEGNVAAAKKGETASMEVINTIITFAQDKGYYAQFYTTACEQAGIEE